MWHCLADNLFEEVEPVAVLKARKNENGTRDFLVKWSDGTEDSWVRTGILFNSPLCPVPCPRDLSLLKSILCSAMHSSLR